jgi:4-hydroxyphenylpyruvate dioxygenase
MYGSPACPPAPKSMSIEFLEFAVCRSEISSMSSFFATLGFTKSGEHRTKDIQWYSNGSVSLVLNAHPDSHGEKYYRSHGSSLCALALRVGTAGPAIARARALGYEIVPPWTLGLEGANISAVKTPDGMLIYIVDSDSSSGQDFIPCQPTTPINGVYTGVDHITISTTVEEMLGLKLCYRALFGMNMRKEMDVVDPHGLVTSWSLDNGEFRILLCSSDSPRAMVRRGKGVVGVSLRTDNVLAAAARLKTIRCSGPGGRYYEDLSRRYQISTGLVEELKSKGLLYEEDGNCGAWQGCFTGWKAQGGCWWGLAERNCFDGYPMASLAAQMACLQQQEVEKREGVVESIGKTLQPVATVGWRVWAELARMNGMVNGKRIGRFVSS